MILKRKLFKKKQLLLKYRFLKKELKTLIKKSLLKNHYNSYLFRLSFTVDITTKYCKKKYFLKTMQKLVCPYTLSKKVPSKHFAYSRFFLNKRLTSLKFSNVFT